MKTPEECQDMQEIRKEIDQIDKNVIDLLGLRFNYVKAVAKFKKNELEVNAPDRLVTMLSHRRNWAKEKNLSPEVIEKMYRDLVNYFIDQELKHFKEA
jgi:isochorismate pyruvate lyase